MNKYNNKRKGLKKTEKKELKGFNFLFDSYFKVYFQILNAIGLIEKSGFWYCFCKKFQACELHYNRGRRYSFLCQINYYYNTEDVEDIKYKPVVLINYASDFYSDLKKCVEIDSTLAECRGGEFEYKWRDISEGT